jgi:ERCC4-related helicase
LSFACVQYLVKDLISMSTAYHARYFAHDLTRKRPSADVDRLSMSLFDACVDLNPHQIEAAMFALKSPLSKGVILADEVGLGKTIEAGLVLCQYWAERRRRVLVICPAAIRKQWSLELEEKFNLPTLILDAPTYKQLQRDGVPQPFLSESIVVTSIHFASTMQGEVRAIPWDVVVIDEAHKLRNAYRASNRMGQRLREALEDRRKLLLTATPLQNSLLELYGLSTIIDGRIFGEVPSFRTQYMNQGADLDELRARLQYFCKRMLRKQVVEYIQYTERRALTVPFRPGDEEQRLYDAVSHFLLREDTYSIPSRQRIMTTLILRKLLASSSYAIAGTLDTLKARLVKLREGLPPEESVAEQLVLIEEMEEEYLEEVEEAAEAAAEETAATPEPAEPKVDRQKLEAEIAELERYSTWARSIGTDTKSRALIKALEIGFSKMAEMGANRKALIFTESRRTQQYLKSFLEANGYAGQIVLFSGSNSDPESQAIYQRWIDANRETGRATGSKTIDIRMALIEHFRDHATLMIATEAGAEGINLQFCSLVINYDLPWNPQRIEQRIGRCHRYGQKHDVVVINFLNERNAADQRVLELLAEKFNLFSGVFGASDEVLGTIESGVDFERRILEIYQQCRTPQEIDAAFKKLREELDATIQARIEATRRALLEHFDEDVHARLRVQLDTAREQLDRVGRLFWTLTQFMLRDHATFDDHSLSFQLHTPPAPNFTPGTYRLISKTQPNIAGEFLYRLSHPLGEHVIETGKRCATPLATVAFHITEHPTRIAAVEALKGKRGWLLLQRLVIDSFEREEYLLFSAIGDDGHSLDQETCEKLFRCTGSVCHADALPSTVEDRLAREAQRHAEATIARSLETNNQYFLQERQRLERWADDMVLAAEKDLADTKAQIKAMNRQARLATTLEEQHAIQEKIRELEKQMRRQRQRIFDVEDEIMAKRDALITSLEKRLSQRTSAEHLFTIRWAVE